jgi:hypothetical protein
MKNKKDVLPNEEIEALATAGMAFFSTIFNSIDSFEKFKAKNKELIEKKYKHAGKIITCHLVIESLINTELLTLNKITSNAIEKQQHNFATKLSMLPTEGYYYSYFIKGIERLNKLRNIVAHQLNAEITNTEKDVFDLYFEKFKQPIDEKEDLQSKVVRFTMMCIAVFGIRNPEVTAHWDELAVQYPNMKELLEEIRNTKIKWEQEE